MRIASISRDFRLPPCYVRGMSHRSNSVGGSRTQLSDRDVKRIGRRIHAGERQTDIAYEFGVNRRTIRRRLDELERAETERVGHRSAAPSRGRPTWRLSTCSSCRRTRISTSFAGSLRHRARAAPAGDEAPNREKTESRRGVPARNIRPSASLGHGATSGRPGPRSRPHRSLALRTHRRAVLPGRRSRLRPGTRHRDDVADRQPCAPTCSGPALRCCNVTAERWRRATRSNSSSNERPAASRPFSEALRR